MSHPTRNSFYQKARASELDFAFAAVFREKNGQFRPATSQSLEAGLAVVISAHHD